MIRVIDRSHDLQQLSVTFRDLHEEHQQEKLERLVSRYAKRLSGLTMQGGLANVWIPKVMALCPTRLELPALESFKLISDDEGQVLPDCGQWIAAMISGSPQLPSCSLSSPSTQSAIASTSGSLACGRSSLRIIGLSHIPLEPGDWGVVIKALDYSALRELDIRADGFSMDHVKLLVDCVPVNTNPVGRLHIYISSSILRKDGVEWDSQVARLHAKVPNVTGCK